jgi:hypothetical protein
MALPCPSGLTANKAKLARMKSVSVLLLAFLALPATGQSQQSGVKYISDADMASTPVVKASLRSQTSPVAPKPSALMDAAWQQELAQARQTYRQICEDSNYRDGKHISKAVTKQIELASAPLETRFATYHHERKIARDQMRVLELDKQTELAALIAANGRVSKADRQRTQKVRAKYNQQIRARSAELSSLITRAEMVSSEMQGLQSECVQTARR